MLLLIIFILINILLLGLQLYYLFKQKNYKEFDKKDGLIADIYKQQNDFYLKGQDYERANIAKDLHDGTSGSLYGIKLQLHLLKSKNKAHNKDIESIENYIDKLSHEIKHITKQISPLSLKNYGLTASINEYILDNVVPGINFTLNSTIGNKRYPENIEKNLFKIFQECANNIIKHSAANNVSIILTENNHKILFSIEDDGKGILIDSTKSKGNGLSNIFFRVQTLNGNIDIYSKSNSGTKTIINLPAWINQKK